MDWILLPLIGGVATLLGIIGCFVPVVPGPLVSYLALWILYALGYPPSTDRLAVGAYDGDTLVGLAGCSADCETMWQIGIDVLPEYRRQGIAMALTSRIAAETFERGKVPFYCAAWSNIKSVRNAIACGFVPSWTELTAKKKSEVDKLNGK